MENGSNNLTIEKTVKPCPFCGSEDSNVSELLGIYWVQCFECYASTSLEDHLETALEKWNSRS